VIFHFRLDQHALPIMAEGRSGRAQGRIDAGDDGCGFDAFFAGAVSFMGASTVPTGLACTSRTMVRNRS